jgi:signal recognition particle subunit SRP54
MPDRRRRPGWGPQRRRSGSPVWSNPGQVQSGPRRGYAGVWQSDSGAITPPDPKGVATGVFDTLSDRLTSALSNLRGKGRLSDADIDATAREIRIALLEADVALPVVRQFVGQIKERAKGAEVSGALNPAQQVIKIVNEELVGILGGATRRLELAKIPPTVIMLAGLQGSGKTTLAGKLALWLRAQGHTPLLVAADLQRPNAVTQLQIVGEQAGVHVFAPEPGNGVGDPVDVSRRGVAEARVRHHDIVVVDTAGRLGIDAEMMRQAVDIRDAVRPNEILFVIDAMIGQDAVTTSEAFRDGVGFTGVVLTKLDGDARGGAALSVRQVTGAPILFASNGEKLEDFDVFHPDRMASRILGMGDLLTLIEQAEQAFDADQAEQTAAKIGSGELTLEDFLEQMQAIRKMGPIANLLGMLPGAAGMKEQLAQVDDKQLDRLQAIICGMTPAERADPKIINASRRQRIARGSGVTVSEVNQLVERFFEARKMMQQMAGRFGFPGTGPGRRSRKGKKGKKAKGRGPTPPRTRSGFPSGLPGLPEGLPGGMPELPELPDLSRLPGLDQLPPGFDPSKLKFRKK